MRDGVPLPGVSPADVVWQLTERVFGPLQPNRVQQVLDYHGLAGHPAGTRAQVAARHRVAGATVANQVRTVRAAGARLPLTPTLVIAATRQSKPADDHLARVRIADTLGLSRPRLQNPSRASRTPPRQRARRSPGRPPGSSPRSARSTWPPS